VTRIDATLVSQTLVDSRQLSPFHKSARGIVVADAHAALSNIFFATGFSRA
jgi:hypothetical protein